MPSVRGQEPTARTVLGQGAVAPGQEAAALMVLGQGSAAPAGWSGREAAGRAHRGRLGRPAQRVPPGAVER
ncbi:hypothetical protein JMF97_04180 [Micromonospora fiedleri]|uniref:Uncharacterized protein n=1 Tax=Micromonospora fiedleri TaxID=1157498 RepID=A0ABS1UGA8_9ACTN|nr:MULTISPECIES: hypothetical protein [Micromonospora]MBL6275355.1 hypothetical protein [Micromonospora fiedleri]WSK45766.1 hypothetical protein OG712_23675 [Micromonospora maris]